MKKGLKSVLPVALLLSHLSSFSQAPKISYAGPQTYVTTKAITPLVPGNTGGAVPALAYGQVSTIAGSGTAGSVNGTGASATFNIPQSVATDAQGNIYVADAGNNLIRKITPAGVVTTFAGSGTAGAANGTGVAASFHTPYGLAVDAQGNIYVADAGNNMIRKITALGVVTTLAGDGSYNLLNGPGATASFRYPSGVAVDASGNVYVTDFNNSVIRKITSLGDVSTFAGDGTQGANNGPAAVASFNNPLGIICDATGNVYVGDEGNNLVRKITPQGVVSTFVGSGTAGATNGTGTAASFFALYDLTIDALGNIYVADAGNNIIRKIDPAGVVTTLAGNGQYDFVDGPASSAVFRYPVGVAADASGNLYVADLGNNAIRKINLYGYTISPALPAGLVFDATTGIISGTPTTASPLTTYTISAYNKSGSSTATVDISVSAVSVDASLSALTASAGALNPVFSSTTNNYVVNVANGITSTTVTAVTTNGNATLAINGTAVNSGTASGAISLSVGSNTVNVLVTAQDGSTQTYTIYIIRAAAAIVAPVIAYATPKVYPVGTAISPLTPTNSGGAILTAIYTQVSTFAGSGAFAFTNGTGTAASFNAPQGIATDAQGNLYIADSKNNVIRKVSPAGVVSTFAGNGQQGANNGPAASATFHTPYGVAVDNRGYVYVADAGNNMIRQISPAGTVSTLAGTGDFDFVDGPGASASFRYPTSVATDANDNLYVADLDNNVIRKITLNGVVSTLAGSGATGSANGTGTSASFNQPISVACDAAGNVYVADQVNNLIRKITPAGVVTTFAGSGAAGSTNGTGTAAKFSNPSGVTVDGRGYVYVADANISIIRQITPAAAVTIIAGTGYYGIANGLGNAATFNYPTGVAVDTYGNLYVDDFGNNVIRKVSLVGYAQITPALPAGLSFDATTGTISGTPTAASPATNYTVTGYNTAGSGQTTVNIKVISINSDASLSNLTINPGTLSPVFNSTVYGYTATVPYGTSSVTLTPTANATGITIKVNGNTVASGASSPSITLSAGTTNINVIVTAADGTTQLTYTIAVTVSKATNADLSNLSTTAGTLSPVFNSATLSYSVTVPNSVTSTTVKPTLSDASATVTVNGVLVASGSSSGAIALNTGSNTITTVVTAADGITQKTYTINVTRQLSSTATLSALVVSAGTLSPAFASGLNTYTDNVGNGVTNITVTPTSTDPTATITVNGVTVKSGVASGAIPLVVGSNAVTVIVTAQDGVTTATYTVNVIRAQSSNTDLVNLSLSSGVLTPVFASATHSYQATVATGVTSVTVTPTLSDATAKVTVNGTAVTSGSPSASIALAKGNNTITVSITAQDGVTTGIYTIIVNRQLSSDATLSALTVGTGTLTPIFSPGTLNYTVSVANSVTSLTTTATANDANASINNAGVTGKAQITSSTALNVGSNTITVVVTAEDGVITQTYTVSVIRASSADLSGITTSAGSLSPAFDPATTNYTVTVNNSTTSITVTPVSAAANSAITVNGTSVNSGSASQAIPLSVGSNTITIAVTSPDGNTHKTYTIKVNRQLPNTATLTSLTVSTGILSPLFSSSVNSYTDNVGNSITGITLTPTATDPLSIIKVNGVIVKSGVASGAIALMVGHNAVTVTITAQDGVTVNTYTVDVVRAPSSNANLVKLSLSTGTIAPTFSTTTHSYTATFPSTVTNVSITPTVSDPTATVTVNGTVVISGSASGQITLVKGNNVITTTVTAQDGVTTSDYTITIFRQPSSDATLSSLTIDAGTLSPVFSPGTTSYTASEPGNVTQLNVTAVANDANAIVSINNNSNTGQASAAANLIAGSNTVTVVVTAEDGITTKTYTIVITRAASPNANLASLTTNPGSLSPAFAPAVATYSVYVSNATPSITFSPVVAEANATVTVNGVAVASGATSAAIPLNTGNNTVLVKVTAQDGTVRTYTAVVYREFSNDATLTNLVLNNGKLSPIFNTATESYTATVASSVTSVTVTPTSTSAAATILVNMKAVASGTPSGSISLTTGHNIITVVITSEDKGNQEIYLINVYKEAAKLAPVNTFTPNSDGKNDTWVIAGVSEFPDCTVQVFNRGGHMVFNSTGYSVPWDGRYNNMNLPTGVYYYIINPKKNNAPLLSGTVTIIR